MILLRNNFRDDTGSFKSPNDIIVSSTIIIIIYFYFYLPRIVVLSPHCAVINDGPAIEVPFELRNSLRSMRQPQKNRRL